MVTEETALLKEEMAAQELRRPAILILRSKKTLRLAVEMAEMVQQVETVAQVLILRAVPQK